MITVPGTTTSTRPDRSTEAPDAAARAVGVVRAVCGGVLLLSAPRVARAVHGSAPPHVIEVATRVLGVRELGQGLALAVRPSTGVRRAGTAVDTLHLTSMVGLAAIAGRYRRPAGAAAGAALADLASSALLLLRRRSR